MQAREAAIAAVQRLADTDIVSVVLYDNNVQVLVPATKATDRETIIEAIKQITAHGGTALFAGVSKGAGEVRKFMREDTVNRVILLSDGQANVGPSSTAELANLGQSLLKEGISVSTLGLGSGYNEDLMTSLAASSSGNHVFIENAQDLVMVFNNEFDDILSVVATDFDIRVELDATVRPVRVLGNDADIDGQIVTIPLGQLYAKQLRYFLIEVEVAPGTAGQEQPLASVSVKYGNRDTETLDELTSKLQVRFTDNQEQVTTDINREALAYCTLQITTERNRQATALADAGQWEAAQKLLAENAQELRDCKLFCEGQVDSKTINDLDFGILGNKTQSETVTDRNKWFLNRKSMRQYQNAVEKQQSYTGDGKVAPLPPNDSKGN